MPTFHDLFFGPDIPGVKKIDAGHERPENSSPLLPVEIAAELFSSSTEPVTLLIRDPVLRGGPVRLVGITAVYANAALMQLCILQSESSQPVGSYAQVLSTGFDAKQALLKVLGIPQ